MSPSTGVSMVPTSFFVWNFVGPRWPRILSSSASITTPNRDLPKTEYNLVIDPSLSSPSNENSKIFFPPENSATSRPSSPSPAPSLPSSPLDTKHSQTPRSVSPPLPPRKSESDRSPESETSEPDSYHTIIEDPVLVEEFANFASQVWIGASAQSSNTTTFIGHLTLRGLAEFQERVHVMDETWPFPGATLILPSGQVIAIPTN